jgi:hypothetical protein
MDLWNKGVGKEYGTKKWLLGTTCGVCGKYESITKKQLAKHMGCFTL